jgi:hypothetical protein
LALGVMVFVLLWWLTSPAYPTSLLALAHGDAAAGAIVCASGLVLCWCFDVGRRR